MALPNGIIYMDHAATTPTDPRVIESMLPYFSDSFGNASSIYALGRRSHQALDNAHQQVAEILHCRPTEVIFTGGGSEGGGVCRSAPWPAHHYLSDRASRRAADLPVPGAAGL